MDLTSFVTKFTGNFPLDERRKIIITILILSLLVAPSCGAPPLNQRVWRKIANCAGNVQTRCHYLTYYCRPRIFSKRSTDNIEDLSNQSEHTISKRSIRSRRVRPRYRLNCEICRTYCW